MTDAGWQQAHLDRVARTFALTLRPLPAPLRHPIGNLYLLARIADTIEDDPALSLDERGRFGEQLIAVVEGAADPEPLARDLALRASRETERKLIVELPRLIGITREFDPESRAAMERCIRIMTRGMVEFARLRGPGGLADRDALMRYCWFVAGVVGETLIALYCQWSPAVARRRPELEPLGRHFGLGLQLVNVLKDVREDRERGVCWLPAQLAQLGPDSAEFRAGIRELVGVARRHLDQALRCTLLLPRREAGIRKSCLWPLGLAVLTLRGIERSPGAAVKVRRGTVYLTVILTSALARSNLALRLLYRAL